MLRETRAGPRLVRRIPRIRFSGGFAGPGESVTGRLSGSYDESVHPGAHVRHLNRRVSYVVVISLGGQSPDDRFDPYIGHAPDGALGRTFTYQMDFGLRESHELSHYIVFLAII